jgi:hypothetical protein
MNILDRIRTARTNHQARFAAELDRRFTEKALRKAPNAPVMIARATLQLEVMALQETGWKVTHISEGRAKGTVSVYLLEKANPNLEARLDDVA